MSKFEVKFEHPSESTSIPSGVLGHKSLSSVTPSLSVSFWESAQPLTSTNSPSGVSKHVSISSVTPSPSVSSWDVAHPSAFTTVPAGVSGHLSKASVIPSLSESKSSNSAVILALDIILNVSGFVVPLPVPVHLLKL